MSCSCSRCNQHARTSSQRHHSRSPQCGNESQSCHSQLPRQRSFFGILRKDTCGRSQTLSSCNGSSTTRKSVILSDDSEDSGSDAEGRIEKAEQQMRQERIEDLLVLTEGEEIQACSGKSWKKGYVYIYSAITELMKFTGLVSLVQKQIVFSSHFVSSDATLLTSQAHLSIFSMFSLVGWYWTKCSIQLRMTTRLGEM